MANTKGLGKGLSALLGDDVIAAKDERASSLLLPISQVESCSTQPRKSFEPEALSDLADSIRIHGISLFFSRLSPDSSISVRTCCA